MIKKLLQLIGLMENKENSENSKNIEYLFFGNDFNSQDYVVYNVQKVNNNITMYFVPKFTTAKEQSDIMQEVRFQMNKRLKGI